MKRGLAVVLTACALLAAKPAFAHRMDEYLQASILSLQPGGVSITMRLVPGIAAAPSILADLDRDADGRLSSAEQRGYAERVRADLLLREDGNLLPLRVTEVSFPSIPEMQAGIGEIKLTLAADLTGREGKHELIFQNQHRPTISVYLVNALVPEDAHLQIASQERNLNQSFYRLSFTETASASATMQGFHLSGFAAASRLGMRHIAEGTDHLLFLLTLILPAPLLAFGGRWRQSAPVEKTLIHILRIVTAFTLGHSLTLALSAFGLVRLPSRPVEVLIAVSILVSAIHAIRPLFPGREAAIAGFFGLIHGLAFAAALNELGMTGWYQLVSLLGFNLGIETMQLLVVLLTLPSLLLLSRTRYYARFRTAGGCLAGGAAIAWICERVTNQANGFASTIEKIARHGIAMAALLFACSLLAWFSRYPVRGFSSKDSRAETPTHAGRFFRS